MIASIERAIGDDRVTSLAGALVKLASDGAFDDDAYFAPAIAGRYARRLLWRDPDERFVVIANTWAPGQGTPLHDHNGLWGAEIVVNGTMRESNYRLLERTAHAARFSNEGDTILAERAVGVLAPPFEYHSYHNAGAGVARTLHVYAGMLDRCITYAPGAGEWWRAAERSLDYDV